MRGIAVSYNMGWTKRGKQHNILTGHGASMGLKPNCSTLSNKAISYHTKCFSYAASQNDGNLEFLKSSINSTIPHSFGERSSYNIL